MATIDLGKIKFVNRGTYNNSTAYVADDVVTFTDTVGGLQNTSSYIAVASTTGNAPASGGTVHASWNVLAQGAPDRLPRQTNNAGKFLKTDGSALSFASVEAFVSGMIILWSGAANAIPSGWYLCDGNNSTPDLRGRFVVGHHDSNGDYDVGDTGGAETVTLTTDQIPAHTHNVRTSQGIYYSGGGGYIQPLSSSVSQVSTSTGGGQAHENRPPFYALCYIMKA